jgi:hypothetical protein
VWLMLTLSSRERRLTLIRMRLQLKVSHKVTKQQQQRVMQMASQWLLMHLQLLAMR